MQKYVQITTGESNEFYTTGLPKWDAFHKLESKWKGGNIMGITISNRIKKFIELNELKSYENITKSQGEEGEYQWAAIQEESKRYRDLWFINNTETSKISQNPKFILE